MGEWQRTSYIALLHGNLTTFIPQLLGCLLNLICAPESLLKPPPWILRSQLGIQDLSQIAGLNLSSLNSGHQTHIHAYMGHHTNAHTISQQAHTQTHAHCHCHPPRKTTRIDCASKQAVLFTYLQLETAASP